MRIPQERVAGQAGTVEQPIFIGPGSPLGLLHLGAEDRAGQDRLMGGVPGLFAIQILHDEWSPRGGHLHHIPHLQLVESSGAQPVRQPNIEQGRLHRRERQPVQELPAGAGNVVRPLGSPQQVAPAQYQWVNVGFFQNDEIELNFEGKALIDSWF